MHRKLKRIVFMSIILLYSYFHMNIFSGWKGHKWAQPKVEHLRSLMRHVYENQDEVKVKGQAARQSMLEKYSLSVMGSKLLQEFKRVSQLLEASKEVLEEEVEEEKVDHHLKDEM